MAVRFITGARKGLPVAQARAEIARMTIKQEIEDSAAILLIRCSQFPECHHLEPRQRQRLKSREDNTRQDWRSTARRRPATIKEGRDPGPDDAAFKWWTRHPGLPGCKWRQAPPPMGREKLRSLRVLAWTRTSPTRPTCANEKKKAVTRERS